MVDTPLALGGSTLPNSTSEVLSFTSTSGASSKTRQNG